MNNSKSKDTEIVKTGSLYIVGTPIGNLQDITLRALETLKFVDVILAEDTRHTLKLLNYFKISKHLISYHKHNEIEKILAIKKHLDSGENIALVSDAGMPVISDPGENLIKTLVNEGYDVQVIPGVTAFVTAIVKSSIDASRFVFEGFLSVNKKQRKAKLNELKLEKRTVIFYEAPHKLLNTLKDLYLTLGDRNICIARELTKIHEDYIYLTLSEAINKVEGQPLKGEIVLVIEGNMKDKSDKDNCNDEANAKELEEKLKKDFKKFIKLGMSTKDAAKEIATKFDLNKNDVYKKTLRWR